MRVHSYIVRIYRHEPNDQPCAGLVGTVEAIGESPQWNFRNCEELWTILLNAEKQMKAVEDRRKGNSCI